jgi:hypothetical protein
MTRELYIRLQDERRRINRETKGDIDEAARLFAEVLAEFNVNVIEYITYHVMYGPEIELIRLIQQN